MASPNLVALASKVHGDKPIYVNWRNSNIESTGGLIQMAGIAKSKSMASDRKVTVVGTILPANL